MTLGEKIRVSRENAGLTMEELGKKCGTTKQTIYKYETGKVTNIPLDRLMRIADATDVSASYLMGWEGINAEQRGEDEVTRKLLGFVDTASSDELRQLLDFIAYLISRRSSER